MSDPASSADPINTAVLANLEAVKGQLSLITTMMANNHTATHQRIDDLRLSIGQRQDTAEGRIKRLEENERATAIRVGGIAATSSAVVAAGIEVARRLVGQ